MLNKHLPYTQRDPRDTTHLSTPLSDGLFETFQGTPNVSITSVDPNANIATAGLTVASDEELPRGRVAEVVGVVLRGMYGEDGAKKVLASAWEHLSGKFIFELRAEVLRAQVCCPPNRIP